jgi:predicted outer membrane repeat protein
LSLIPHRLYNGYQATPSLVIEAYSLQGDSMQTRKNIPLIHILLRSATTLIFFSVSWSIIPVKPVRAATIIVSSTSNSGAGSLRQAIADAPAGDTITFASGLSGQTILVTSPLSISKNLIIDGSSLTIPITISGDGAVRVLGIGYTYTVTLKNLIIADGHNSSLGGGIASFGTLILEKCRFSNNYGGISGGGIYSEGTLSVTDSTFDGNSSFEGGGISMRSGTLTVTGSSFTGTSSIVHPLFPPVHSPIILHIPEVPYPITTY